MSLKTIRNLFIAAAFYDVILGVVFLVAFKQIYAYFNIALPNHDGYVQFAACLVTIFGIGFWFVAQDPERNRNIIIMGILLKLSYSGVVFFHYVVGNLPPIWIPFAWFDTIFFVLFIIALKSLGQTNRVC